MSSEELKPCPFCGGKAERFTLQDEENFGGDVIVCTKCDACSRIVFGEKEGLNEAWNCRAQLAAIQGGMGEDVVVLATVSMGGVEYGIGGAELGDIDIQPDMKALCALQQSLVTGEDDAYVELIDKAQHQRITAAMAAEVERWERNFRDIHEPALRDAHAYIQELRAELAEVKGRKPDCFVVGKSDKIAVIDSPLPVGTKLYTHPAPSQPSVRVPERREYQQGLGGLRAELDRRYVNGWNAAISEMEAAPHPEQPQASAAQSAPVVPEGWRLVPVEPTPKMMRAGVLESVGALRVYYAMLAACKGPDHG